MNFVFEKLELSGLVLIKPKFFVDNRGFFLETYKKSVFFENGIETEFIQDNYSKSDYKVLRGLHFQKAPFEQAKLIRCLKGRIFDVVVDLRKDSKTFKQYKRIELSEQNQNSLFIPRGFAHGFVVLSETAEVMYKTDNEYNKDSERSINYCDEELKIDWGIDFEPILSQKDLNSFKFSEILGEL